jgi:hypothetical protein
LPLLATDARPLVFDVLLDKLPDAVKKLVPEFCGDGG